jgi:hypothetical protein
MGMFTHVKVVFVSQATIYVVCSLGAPAGRYWLAVTFWFIESTLTLSNAHR